jgi:acyl-coenzyme A thioesterase PaaI-like protein
MNGAEGAQWPPDLEEGSWKQWRHLGARLVHVGPGRVHIVLPNRPEVTHQHGYVDERPSE